VKPPKGARFACCNALPHFAPLLGRGYRSPLENIGRTETNIVRLAVRGTGVRAKRRRGGAHRPKGTLVVQFREPNFGVRGIERIVIHVIWISSASICRTLRLRAAFGVTMAETTVPEGSVEHLPTERPSGGGRRGDPWRPVSAASGPECARLGLCTVVRERWTGSVRRAGGDSGTEGGRRGVAPGLRVSPGEFVGSALFGGFQRKISASNERLPTSKPPCLSYISFILLPGPQGAPTCLCREPSPVAVPRRASREVRTSH